MRRRAPLKSATAATACTGSAPAATQALSAPAALIALWMPGTANCTSCSRQRKRAPAGVELGTLGVVRDHLLGAGRDRQQLRSVPNHGGARPTGELGKRRLQV